MKPHPDTLEFWSAVAGLIDNNQPFEWRNAVNSLNDASHHLLTSPEARDFVDHYMMRIMLTALKNRPIGMPHQTKKTIKNGLRQSVSIVAMDLRSKIDPSTGKCKVLDVLALVFNREQVFYTDSEPSKYRLAAIRRFHDIEGFSFLASYLSSSVTTSRSFSKFHLHYFLTAVADIIPSSTSTSNAPPASDDSSYGSIHPTGKKARSIEDDALQLAQAAMNYIERISLSSIDKFVICKILPGILRIFELISLHRRLQMNEFHGFWRCFILKLISQNPSLNLFKYQYDKNLELFGWKLVSEIIKNSIKMRSPPKAFVVGGAGTSFVNGRYEYAGPMTEDGFARHQSQTKYVRIISDTVLENNGGDRTLTLFLCDVTSEEKWWCLSEADKEQPGTNKDIDYYFHKSESHEWGIPPILGWTTRQGVGLDPPPKLRAIGLMVPNGEEHNTLDDQLTKWVIDNRIIDLALKTGDQIVLEESICILKFLADMYKQSSENKKTNEDTPGLIMNYIKTCFHTACTILDIPVNYIKALLEDFPDWSKLKDKNGCTPLMIALRTRCDSEVLFLLMENTEVVRIPSLYNQLPLHFAAKCDAYAIHALIDAYPSACWRRDTDGKLPLHYFVDEMSSARNVKFILNHFKEATKFATHDGRLPLHFAAKCNTEVIKALIEADPDACEKQDLGGRLPLHWFATHCESEDALMCLIDGFPGGLLVKSKLGKTPEMISRNVMIKTILSKERKKLISTNSNKDSDSELSLNESIHLSDLEEEENNILLNDTQESLAFMKMDSYTENLLTGSMVVGDNFTSDDVNQHQMNDHDQESQKIFNQSVEVAQNNLKKPSEDSLSKINQFGNLEPRIENRESFFDVKHESTQSINDRIETLEKRIYGVVGTGSLIERLRSLYMNQNREMLWSDFIAELESLLGVTSSTKDNAVVRIENLEKKVWNVAEVREKKKDECLANRIMALDGSDRIILGRHGDLIPRIVNREEFFLVKQRRESIFGQLNRGAAKSLTNRIEILEKAVFGGVVETSDLTERLNSLYIYKSKGMLWADYIKKLERTLGVESLTSNNAMTRIGNIEDHVLDDEAREKMKNECLLNRMIALDEIEP